MSKEKQISEMAKIICNKANELNKNWYEYSHIFEQPSEIYAAELYNAGYRKQSAVIDEFVQNLKEEMKNLTRMVYSDKTVYLVDKSLIDRIAEKMKGGAE